VQKWLRKKEDRDVPALNTLPQVQKWELRRQASGLVDGPSVTTASIGNALYRLSRAKLFERQKSDHDEDGSVQYRESQSFAVSNQNWENRHDGERHGRRRLLVRLPMGTRQSKCTTTFLKITPARPGLQVYRRGDDWYCTFNIEYECNADISGETHIGVDIGERHTLVETTYSEGESMLVSSGEGSTSGVNISLSAIRFEKRVREVSNHWLEPQPPPSPHHVRRPIREPVIQIEDLEGIRENSS
jgi:putative transposase